MLPSEMQLQFCVICETARRSPAITTFETAIGKFVDPRRRGIPGVLRTRRFSRN